MPIYEYRCSDCGEKFERLVRSHSSKETPTCPNCGSQAVDKAISLFSVGSNSRSSSASCAPASST